MRDPRETAYVRILCEIVEILSSIGMGATSELGEEIPALRRLILKVEGLAPDERAELQPHAAELVALLKSSSTRRDGEMAVAAHRMANIIRARLEVLAELMG